MSFKITVLPSAKVIEANEGDNLLKVLRDAGVAPEAPCGGHGTCKKCKVVIDGVEELACGRTVDCNMTVYIPEKVKTNILASGTEIETSMNPVREGYLIAFDIGTTTVVCYLLDTKDGSEIAHASMLNPQAPYGADVISRMQIANGGQLAELAQVVREGLCTLIKDVCNQAGIKGEEVGVVSVVGNPCMQQLFMGVDTKNLATIPFAPVLTKADIVECKDYLPVCPNAKLLVIPDISGYVGGDTMGCVLSTRMYEKDEISLMVDIGTNGEMVLGNKEKMTACSTAAGPALEGAKIKFGMRGAPGAIDHVWTENGEIKCSVIGGGEAEGICGSGLIDAVAVALQLGLINKRGRIASKDEIDGDRFVRLTDKVYLTQQDIREVQLAKGAIAAGIKLMAEHIGITLGEIDKVLLAGAFGNFMDPQSACSIGLLPYVLNDRVSGIGNAAGAGAKLAACNKDELELTGRLLDKIEFIELASIPSFQMTFARCMGFDNDEDDD